MAYKDVTDPRNRAAKRRHYYKNKQQYLDRNLALKNEKREWLRAQKNVPCADCGNSYPYYVMDFDHLDPETKVCNVGQLLNRSWDRLKAEVAKCGHCGRFISERQIYTDCPNCGGENRP